MGMVMAMVRAGEGDLTRRIGLATASLIITIIILLLRGTGY